MLEENSDNLQGDYRRAERPKGPMLPKREKVSLEKDETIEANQRTNSNKKNKNDKRDKNDWLIDRFFRRVCAIGLAFLFLFLVRTFWKENGIPEYILFEIPLAIFVIISLLQEVKCTRKVSIHDWEELLIS